VGKEGECGRERNGKGDRAQMGGGGTHENESYRKGNGREGEKQLFTLLVIGGEEGREGTGEGGEYE
jgi:hypothetical protein